MKKIFTIIFLIMLVVLTSCNRLPINEETEGPEKAYTAPLQSESPSTLYPPPPNSFKEILPEDLDYQLIDPPETNAGKALLYGVLYSYTVNMVIPGTAVYLTPAIGENKDRVPPTLVGPQESRGDFVTTTDNNGFILFNNVTPGNYFLIVWAPLNWAIVETSEIGQEPKLISVGADEKNDIGIAYVSWP